MMTGLVIMYGILAGVAIIVFLDWLARRKDRQTQNQTRG
jgi:type II secretory pathway pseudopilin PulG